MAAAAILDFCTMWILTVNLTVGPYFQPMFQIWCKCMQKWPSYGQKCDFQYGGRRHLGFCWIRVLRVKSVQRPYSRCLYQIWCKSVQKWRSYGHLTDFKMAAAAILDFCTMWIWRQVWLPAGPHFQPTFQFGANACNSGRVMARNVIFNMTWKLVRRSNLGPILHCFWDIAGLWHMLLTLDFM